MKGKKITTNNYFEIVEEIGFENLPKALQESHMVINSKTIEGENWSVITEDTDLKRMVNLAFKKLEEFMDNKKELSGLDEKKVNVAHSSKNKSKVEYKTEVSIIKKFFALDNQLITAKELNELIEELQEAIVKRKITKHSPFSKEIKFIQTGLLKIYNGTDRNQIKVNFLPATKKKLLNVLQNAGKYQKSIFPEPLAEKIEDISLKGIENTEAEQAKQDEGKIMSSVDFTELNFNSIGFTGKWLDFIGDPAPGFTAMVFGMPKMGKSYLCVDFAGYLARNHGKVLYVAKEEKLDKTLQDKLKEKEVAHENLFVADSLPTDLKDYDFIFLDSVNKLGLSPKDLEKLKTDNKGKSFIFVFQATKGGQFKGNNEFQHDVDVVIEVPQQGKAVQFGRFNQGGEMNIFEHSPAEKELNGIKKGRNDSEVSKNKSNIAVMKKKTPKTIDWTESTHLNSSDRRDLKLVKKYYDEGKMKEAMNYASRLETIVREEIPPQIWQDMGGELTTTGKEKLKFSADFNSRHDDINPNFIFATTSTALLVEALRSEFDLKKIIRQELANRGQNEKGDWVGFDQAAKIHKIKK